MSEAKRLRAYPAEMPMVCLVRDKSSLRLLAMCLAGKEVRRSILSYSGTLCLGLLLKTKDVPGLLPRLCEYSDTVCIGRSYPELFAEHGEVLISEDAVAELSSH